MRASPMCRTTEHIGEARNSFQRRETTSNPLAQHAFLRPHFNEERETRTSRRALARLVGLERKSARETTKRASSDWSSLTSKRGSPAGLVERVRASPARRARSFPIRSVASAVSSCRLDKLAARLAFAARALGCPAASEQDCTRAGPSARAIAIDL